jgi:hypothetical protein
MVTLVAGDITPVVDSTVLVPGRDHAPSGLSGGVLMDPEKRLSAEAVEDTRRCWIFRVRICSSKIRCVHVLLYWN